MPEKAKQEKEQMVGMEHIKQCVNFVLTDFANTEAGNHITKYGVQGLANHLIGFIANPDSLKPKQGNDEPPKEKSPKK